MKWKEYKISEAIDIIGGGTPKTSVAEYWDGDIPWLSVKDFNNDYRTVSKTERTITKEGLKNSSAKLLKKGDLIISARGTVGALAQLGKDMAFNQSCYGLRANKKTENTFIYYLLKNELGQILSNTHGSVFDTITRETFESLKAFFPPLPEQRAIAEILSSIDDKIELNNQMNRTLEATAQAIFKQWFVNYEFPTSINEGLEPFVNRSGGRMVDSELGPIPEGWRVGTISSVSSFISRGVSPQYSDDHGDLVINQRCIRDRKVSLANARRNTKKIMSEKYIQFGDVLINSTGMGTLGRVAQVYEKIDLCTADSHVTIARPSSNINYNYYGMLLLNLEEYFESQGAGSTGQTELNKRVVEDKLVIIPDSGITEIFSERIEAIRNRILSNDKESQTLSTLRDSLLPKLMSGELRVPEEIVKGFEDMGCDA
jgi:type I restriction enzyme S subunit